ncbi:AAA family ATPase [Corynebacterium poyangense]|uniref:AAA family ATPase n=1 Tax=Corynebacterium poyangense TaxID=2684405 RepID=A0A7H0SP35_9CORY|nr:replication-associated recombination protein A [Corynebacterium poyangense]MBZ8177878.1 AAA family ATPase [Corynebacterium poyangense]QNQ90310.1 AAA family ATPase [Corynebacterium poyangense]
MSEQGELFEHPAPGGNVGGSTAQGREIFAAPTGAPLAARMRPTCLDDVAGQEHLLGPGKPLRRLIEGSGEASVILYGPPGTGKTTIASLISTATQRKFIGLSALSSGVKEVRAVIDQARRDLIHGHRTVLFIDEVHRFSKTQQDALLAAVENRTVLLVAATTENPSFSVVAPLLSRSLLLQLRPLSDEALREVILRAISDDQGLAGRVSIDEDALTQLVLLAGGDARRALTYLEAAAEAVNDGQSVSIEVLRDNINRAVVRYDRDGDQHYDVISAYIKSIRGSDVDAALHYLARMVEAGEDPRFIARRLIIHASEDIGLADPTALTTAVNAAQAVALVGMPEARLTLAQATIHLATAPKSNAVIEAMNAAQQDVREGKIGPVPPHLRDGHYEGAKKLGNAVGYRYPHDDPTGIVKQQYIPEILQEARYYRPRPRGAEKRIYDFLDRLRTIVRGAG